MNDEEELLMEISKQRLAHVASSDRVFAFTFELIPYINAVAKLLNSIIEDDQKEAARAIKKILSWQADIELNILLNIFDPTEPHNLSAEFRKRKFSSLKDISTDEMNDLGDFLSDKAHKIYDEWDLFAEDKDFPNREKMQRKYKEQLIRMAFKGMTSKHGPKGKKKKNRLKNAKHTMTT